jgi:pimeloyl-ACP methyl ester carboxylesterase
MTPPIYLIPGLGADHRNYPSCWRELPGCTCLEWPEYHGEPCLPAVARFLIESWKLPPNAVLIGSSFGGAMACELAKLHPVHSLVLVASATSGEDFVTTARMKRLTRILPLRLMQMLFRCSRPALEAIWGRSATPVTRGILDSIQMFSSCQPAFYRNMFQALSTWEGFVDDRTRVIRIHGRHDKMVATPATADLWLEGGHLIAMTHARECVDFLQARLFSSAT